MGDTKRPKNSLSIFVLIVLLVVSYVFGAIDNGRLEEKIGSLEKKSNVFEADTKLNVNQIYFQSLSLSRRIGTLENFEMMRLNPDFQEKQKQYKEQLEKQGGENANK